MATYNIVIIGSKSEAVIIVKRFFAFQKDFKIAGIFKILEDYLASISTIEIPDIIVVLEPPLNFTELHKQLVGLDLKHELLLVSDKVEDAIVAFENHAVDFILNPLNSEKLEVSIGKFIAQNEYKFGKGNQDVLIIKQNYKKHKILISDIIYIESLREYLNVHCRGNNYKYLGTIKNAISDLKDKGFIQIHKSYLVSTKAIKGYNYNSVNLEGGAILPIGRFYLAEFKEFMNRGSADEA